MKFTKESILKSLNSLTMPTWIKRVFQLIVDYIDDTASSINNKADLVDGKVPAEQLPSYVDDVVEFQSIISYNGLKGTIGYASYKDKLFFISTDPYKNKFINTKDNTAESDWEIIEPEDGKIYININDNHSYRWTGSTLLDLDKEFSNGINVLNNIVKVANIGTVSNLDDIAEGDQSNIDQNGMSQLFSFLFNYKSYRNSYIQFENEDLDGRLCRIIDINGGKRQFTIYNNGALQTYKQLNTGGKYSLEKISSIPGYVYFDYNDASINKIAANSLKTNKAVPALLVMDGYVFTGYCTKVNEDTTTFIVFNKQAMETYYMNNLTGRFTFINTLDTDTIVNYDSIRGSKTNAEAKQELINILAGDTVVLDYNNAGQVLDNNTINALKKANSIILLNDNTSIESSKCIYTVVTKNNAYLYFCTAKYLASNGGSLTYNELTINLANSSWNIYSRDFIFPYGAFLAEGYTGKSQAQVNKEIANVSLLNFYKITNSDLNKVHSGDKLENIKNATFLILDEGSGKTKIFVRGYTSTTIIYYNCISNSGSVNSILLRMPSNTLSSIETTQFDDVFYSYYSAKGGTKANKDAMYKELIAQLTENTYVIDSSRLNTVLTDAEASSVQNATTLIISNSNTNNLLVFKKGYIGDKEIYFTNINLVSGGSLSINRIIYNTTTKTCSNIALSTVDPYTWYIGNGGNKSNKNDFININKVLYNNTYIIDKTLLNITITDTSIQDNIKNANILVVKDSTDNNYTLYIRGVANTDSLFFYNIDVMISTSINVKRIEFRISTNVLSANTVYFSSVFKNYQLGGGTKYTTESAFNAQFAKVIDMTVTQ